MKILVISNVNPVLGSLDYSLIKSFTRNGNTVQTIYPEQLFSGHKSNRLFSRIQNRILNSTNFRENSILKKIEKLETHYDFCLVIKGLYVTKETLDLLRLKTNVIFNFNPDDPYNQVNTNSNILQTINMFDLHFCWSWSLVEKIREKEKTGTKYLPFACDFDLHNVSRKDISVSSYPVSFIGNWDEEREDILRGIVDKSRLKIFGFNWNLCTNSNDLFKCWSGIEVEPLMFPDYVAASTINLNVLRLQNKNSCNMRTFEILCCGGFQLHEYSSEVADLFKEDQDLSFFRCQNELNEKIDYFLKHPDETARISAQGLRKVREGNFGYDDRARTILDTYREYA